MKTLSIKQKMLLEAIDWYIKENGYSPTFRELADLLDSDVNSVFKKALVLEEKGYITTVPSKARTIKIIKELPDD